MPTKPKITEPRKRHITAAEFVNSTMLPLMILMSVGVWACFVMLVWSIGHPIKTEIVHERVVEVPLIAPAEPPAAASSAQKTAPAKSGAAWVNGARAW